MAIQYTCDRCGKVRPQSGLSVINIFDENLEVITKKDIEDDDRYAPRKVWHLCSSCFSDVNLNLKTPPVRSA